MGDSPMIVNLGFYKRKPGTTWEQFSDYWQNYHGPMVRDDPTFANLAHRYVQHHLRPREGFPRLEFDGFSEIWYENIESANMVRTMPGRPRIVGDEANFLDMGSTRAYMLDLQVIQIGSVPVIGKPS